MIFTSMSLELTMHYVNMHNIITNKTYAGRGQGKGQTCGQSSKVHRIEQKSASV